jgi:hypothetical protein
MPAPSVRYKILPARGDKTALDAAIAAIDEGEICYARDEDRFYVKESGVLVLTSMEEAPNDGTQYVRRNEAWEAVDVPPGTVVSNVAPVAPDNGQLWYDTEDARIFVWTGTEWADASPDAGNPTVITSDSAPGAPQDGDLWFRTSDGRMYVYYDDGASSQWVDANPATGASNWNYDGTTLTPGTAGTDVDLGTGDLSAAAGTFSGDVSVEGTAGVQTAPIAGYDPLTAFAVGESAGTNRPIGLFYSSDTAYQGSGIKVQHRNTTNPNAKFFEGVLGTTPTITLNANGQIFSPATYDTTTTAGPRSLNIGTTGVFAGLTSLRAAKKNIDYNVDYSWITQLKPVSYLYRKETEAGTYSEDTYTDLQYGLIAEDVEPINPALCNYNKDGDLIGIEYQRLITPLLASLQTALTRIEALESANAALEARLSTLEGGS